MNNSDCLSSNSSVVINESRTNVSLFWKFKVCVLVFNILLILLITLTVLFLRRKLLKLAFLWRAVLLLFIASSGKVFSSLLDIVSVSRTATTVTVQGIFDKAPSLWSVLVFWILTKLVQSPRCDSNLNSGFIFFALGLLVVASVCVTSHFERRLRTLDSLLDVVVVIAKLCLIVKIAAITNKLRAK